ncbi:MAG: SPFH domain-containing protein, partial [Clostridia bacterium]|nr:SPFH domain-containing protein [Clostridia bacterium]
MGILSGIGNVIKGQLIDVIEWSDSSSKTMVHKYDMNGKEIMMGAQLTVRESQAAVFVNEGQLADIFGPGRYELSTSNMPIMTALKSWKYGFNSPFKSDVYFVNTKQFLDMKWGTSNPVMMRDAEFGMIRLRAFGIYSFKVSNVETFLKEVFGTTSLFTVEGVEGQIKRTIVSGLSDAIAESKIPALDLAANYDELANYALNSVNPKLAQLGLTLCSFVIENISLPEEVEKSMDKRTSMGVLGNLDQYAKYQAAEAMREAANNPAGGGMAGMGVGM